VVSGVRRMNEVNGPATKRRDSLTDGRTDGHTPESDRTRGHSLKSVEHRCHLEIRRQIFSERVISRWNADTVSASTVKGFESELENERIKKTD